MFGRACGCVLCRECVVSCECVESVVFVRACGRKRARERKP
jgi:hypothetical protein